MQTRLKQETYRIVHSETAFSFHSIPMPIPTPTPIWFRLQGIVDLICMAFYKIDLREDNLRFQELFQVDQL